MSTFDNLIAHLKEGFEASSQIADVLQEGKFKIEDIFCEIPPNNSNIKESYDLDEKFLSYISNGWDCIFELFLSHICDPSCQPLQKSMFEIGKSCLVDVNESNRDMLIDVLNLWDRQPISNCFVLKKQSSELNLQGFLKCVAIRKHDQIWFYEFE